MNALIISTELMLNIKMKRCQRFEGTTKKDIYPDDYTSISDVTIHPKLSQGTQKNYSEKLVILECNKTTGLNKQRKRLQV
jgi:hypothetical protein